MKIKMFRGLDESGLNHPIFIDLDSDGDYDFVLPAGDYPKYFQNDGDDSDPYFVEVDTMFLFLKPYLNPYQVWSYHVMHNIRFFDYDSDGDQDLGNVFEDWVKDTVHIFENIGSPQHPHWSNTPVFFSFPVLFHHIPITNYSH